MKTFTGCNFSLDSIRLDIVDQTPFKLHTEKSPPKLKLWMFRHGQTDWNQQKRWQGFTDIPLNQTGINQAKVLAEFLRPHRDNVSKVLSSNLSRALHTAQLAFADSGLNIEVNENLREVSGGVAEGKTGEEIVAEFGPESLQKWKNAENLDFHFPKGESKKQLISRVKPTLEKYFGRTNGLVAVFTHGGVIRNLAKHPLNHPEERLAVKNCSGYEFQFDGSDWHFVEQICDGE